MWETLVAGMHVDIGPHPFKVRITHLVGENMGDTESTSYQLTINEHWHQDFEAEDHAGAIKAGMTLLGEELARRVSAVEGNPFAYPVVPDPDFESEG